MKMSVHMAIMSHLSDVQELMNHGSIVEANDRIIFVKMIIMRYPDANTEVEQKDLDLIWNNLKKMKA